MRTYLKRRTKVIVAIALTFVLTFLATYVAVGQRWLPWIGRPAPLERGQLEVSGLSVNHTGTQVIIQGQIRNLSAVGEKFRLRVTVYDLQDRVLGSMPESTMQLKQGSIKPFYCFVTPPVPSYQLPPLKYSIYANDVQIYP